MNLNKWIYGLSKLYKGQHRSSKEKFYPDVGKNAPLIIKKNEVIINEEKMQ